MNEEVAEVQRRECTLCLARYLEVDPDVADPFGLFCTAWFGGLDAGRVPPRELAEVDRELAMVRDRVAAPRGCTTDRYRCAREASSTAVRIS